MIEKDTGHIVVTGNPADGFEYFTDVDGKPFQDTEDANYFAENNFPNEDWWVIPTRTLLPEPGSATVRRGTGLVE